ncbi:CPBP family glutamic-type intramembrane protease [Streptomyces puniciscabiei]|uniref:CPBP family glutamic-type intramembrane protease n=1 Tax=Streptomyces puniciscabiei TaxID=164348 RepID=UPI00331C89D4
MSGGVSGGLGGAAVICAGYLLAGRLRRGLHAPRARRAAVDALWATGTACLAVLLLLGAGALGLAAPGPGRLLHTLALSRADLLLVPAGLLLGTGEFAAACLLAVAAADAVAALRGRVRRMPRPPGRMEAGRGGSASGQDAPSPSWLGRLGRRSGTSSSPVSAGSDGSARGTGAVPGVGAVAGSGAGGGVGHRCVPGPGLGRFTGSGAGGAGLGRVSGADAGPGAGRLTGTGGPAGGRLSGTGGPAGGPLSGTGGPAGGPLSGPGVGSGSVGRRASRGAGSRTFPGVGSVPAAGGPGRGGAGGRAIASASAGGSNWLGLARTSWAGRVRGLAGTLPWAALLALLAAQPLAEELALRGGLVLALKPLGAAAGWLAAAVATLLVGSAPAVRRSGPAAVTGVAVIALVNSLLFLHTPDVLASAAAQWSFFLLASA